MQNDALQHGTQFESQIHFKQCGISVAKSTKRAHVLTRRWQPRQLWQTGVSEMPVRPFNFDHMPAGQRVECGDHFRFATHTLALCGLSLSSTDSEMESALDATFYNEMWMCRLDASLDPDSNG